MKNKRRWLAMIACFAVIITGSLSGITASAEEPDSSNTTLEVSQENQDIQEENDSVEIISEENTEENNLPIIRTEEPDEGEGEAESETETGTEQEVGIEYQAHVQTYGWQKPVKGGETAGTSGQSKRIEAIKISLNNLPEEYADSGIEYQVHVQTYGWQNAVKDGELAGTTGKSKRLEAISIRLTGSIANDYSVYYRTHVQSFGWLGWACDGAKAGSAAYSKRMEAVEIVLVKKNGGTPPVNESGVECYKYPKVQYQAHVQSYGWLSKVTDGAIGGVTGKSKRIEALTISLPETEYSGGISYRMHVQGIGWQDWKNDGQLAGTSGQSKRVEAMEIKLTGDMANYYDVYYSVHMAKIGWTDYACNGETAGSSGLSKRIEAVRIQLVKKGEAAPSTSGLKYVQGYADSDLYYTGVPMGESVSGNIAQGQTVGTTGQSKALTGITLYLNQDSSNPLIPTGTIQYATYLSSTGWTDWSTQGNFSGSADGSKGMEAVKIQLSGDIAKYYDIYYRTSVQKYGWLGWAKNGQTAGTGKIGYRLEAMQIRLVSKDASAPGSNSGYYTENKYEIGPDAAMYARANMYSSSTPYLIMVDRSAHRVGIYQGSRGFWRNVKYWPCSDGAPGTPTVTGVFRVGSKGYYFDSGNLRCYYFTQFYGDYLFHSVPYVKTTGQPDDRLGIPLSHGCVRLATDNAKWIYDTVPAGTTVVVYN